jgi:hypothetical protein
MYILVSQLYTIVTLNMGFLEMKSYDYPRVEAF